MIKKYLIKNWLLITKIFNLLRIWNPYNPYNIDNDILINKFIKIIKGNDNFNEKTVKTIEYLLTSAG